MTDLDKAREWAEDGKGLYSPGSRAKAVIDIILSLPDHWVDAEKVREIADDLESLAQDSVLKNRFVEQARRLRNLTTPKLPTLADMSEEEREACKWMQCRIGDTSSMGVITGYDEVGEFEYCTSVTFRDEADTWFDPSLVIPLPELPKLEWPGGVVDCEIVEESAPTDPDPIHTPMQPSEVPANEPWLVKANGQKAVGTRYEGNSVVPWSVAALDGSFAGDHNDREVTLIHKLVAETTALPEGMRLADHAGYGRVVVSPKDDLDGDYQVFCSQDQTEYGASWWYAHKSELTFLDGDQHV